MKKVIFFMFMLQLFFSAAVAQKFNVGVSLNLMKDYNWDKPLDSWASSINMQRNTLPVNIGIVVEKQYAVLSPSVGIQFIDRKLFYSTEEDGSRSINDCNHRMLEMPIHLTYRKKLNSTASFISLIGGGIGYAFKAAVISKFDVTSPEGDVSSCTIKIQNPDKILWFADIGIGIENDFGKAGKLQMKLQFNGYVTKWLQYAIYDRGFEPDVTRHYRPFYFSTGITYFLPQLCKKK